YLGRDAGDLDFGVPLTVALTLHVVLAATELDDADLVATTMSTDFSSHLGTFNNGCTDVDVITVTDQQYAIELNSGAGFGFQLLYSQVFAFVHLVLLTTSNNYCVHVPFSVLRLTRRLVVVVSGRHGCPRTRRPGPSLPLSKQGCCKSGVQGRGFYRQAG